MKPAAFDYVRPETTAEALEALNELGDDAKVLAGGQSLVPMLNLRLARPEVLVDISRLNLTEFTATSDGIRIGALNKHRRFEFDEEVSRAVPLLRECVTHIGYPAIRNVGTFGGSLAHADSTAEWSCAVLAMDGTIQTESKARGQREIPIEQFLLGPFTTALEPDEILTSVWIPTKGTRRNYAFAEFAERTGDFAIGSTVVGLDPVGSSGSRVVSTGLSGRPVRLIAVEQLLDEEPAPTSQHVGDALSGDLGRLEIDRKSRGHVVSIIHSLLDECLERLHHTETGGKQ